MGRSKHNNKLSESTLQARSMSLHILRAPISCLGASHWLLQLVSMPCRVSATRCLLQGCLQQRAMPAWRAWCRQARLFLRQLHWQTAQTCGLGSGWTRPPRRGKTQGRHSLFSGSSSCALDLAVQCCCDHDVALLPHDGQECILTQAGAAAKGAVPLLPAAVSHHCATVGRR